MHDQRPINSDVDDASAYSRRAAAADSLWVAQDRVRNGVAGAFERMAFGFQDRLLWPLQDRAATMGAPARALSSAAALVLAAAAVAAGLLVASPDESSRSASTRIAVASAPAEPPPAPKPAEPTLRGAAPVFEPVEAQPPPEVDPAEAIVKSAPAKQDSPAADAEASAAAASTSASDGPEVNGPPAGPEAIAVARDFADAFLLYETGETDSEVRQAFGETATPALAKALLERPPRHAGRRRGAEGQSRQPRAGALGGRRLPGQRLAAAGRADQRAAARHGTAERRGVARHQRARLAMNQVRKIRAVAATATATVALCAPFAASAVAEEPVTPGAALAEPASPTTAPAPAPVQQGTTLAPPPSSAPAPTTPPASGGVSAGDGEDSAEADGGKEKAAPAPEGSEGAVPAPSPATALAIPSLPSSSCAATGVPPVLIPMYQRAAARYELGPQGPAVLAGINLIETAFGTNLNVSSAGALGWMQFMPETWEAYGVDANGDGVADPYNPEDAIFAAANYLRASGMPADTYGAIFAYNHADWYVADVLANAGCYAEEVGSPAFGANSARASQVFNCAPAPAWREKIPHEYLRAFEDAAARYELGKRGVWALAAIARLESDFGRGMSERQLRETGPLGLDEAEWSAYAVDGDEDGRIRHADPVDSAATLARLIWSRGSLSAGIFTHNQAEWYVQEVLQQAEEIEGECKTRYVDWALAPLATGLETPGATGGPQRRPGQRAGGRARGGQGGYRGRQLDRLDSLRVGRRARRLVLLRLRLLRRRQLRPLRRRPARHAARLRRPRRLRRARARQVDNDLRQRQPHLRGDRRPALGYGRQPSRGLGAALARRAPVPRGLRSSSPGRVLVPGVERDSPRFPHPRFAPTTPGMLWTTFKRRGTCLLI